MKKLKLPLGLIKFVKYVTNKGSIIIKDYIQRVDNIERIKDTINLFFSINSYKKGAKNRKQENISSINFFFFDVDMKDNTNLTKEEIIDIFEDYEEYFDIIQITKNGVQAFIEIKNSQYGNDTGKLDFDGYIKDWKIKIEKFSYEMGLNFDKNCIKSTQIARVAGSIHKKPNQDEFQIKLKKGEKLLRGETTMELINKTSILDVINKLGLRYNHANYSLYDFDGTESSGWKIDVENNYVNDFSKMRPKGEPFAFVLGFLNLTNGVRDANYGLTYKFFEENFGIIGREKREKTIKVNKAISLHIDNNTLSKENIKYLLYLLYRNTKNNINDGKYTNRISLDEFINFIGDEKLKKTTLKTNLENLSKNNKLETNILDFEVINIEFKKEKGVHFRFCILPNIDELKDQIYDSRFYHYFNRGILNYKLINNEIMSLYFHLHKKLIISKRQSIFLKNEFINTFRINKNPSLRNKILKENLEELGDFEVKKIKNSGFEIINKKV
ncbi:MAG: hypothetical protein PHE25_06340 [Candidatus Gracilibacteria bacterium]|nr:hypothetical protein [Candidatus Gracilibacteria bacterium]